MSRGFSSRWRQIVLTTAAFTMASAAMATVATADDRAASVAQTVAAESSSMTADEKHAADLRSQFGLPADLAHVQAVAADAEADLTALGIPLTTAEAADIVGRQALTGIVDKLLPVGSAVPGFAGIWIDQAAGGVLHVNYSSPVSTGMAGTLRQLAAPAELVISTVKYALVKLQATQAAIAKTMIAINHPAVQINSAILQPKSNNIAVEIMNGTPSSVADELIAQYGDQLNITYGGGWVEQSSRDVNSGRLYGGQWLEKCTVGYSKLVGAGRYFSLTAGHCIGNGYGDFFRGKAGKGAYLGPTYWNKYVPGGSGYCDCRSFGPLPSGLQTNSVLVAGANPPYAYGRTGTASNYVQGQPECSSGAAFADANGGRINCGQVIGTGPVTTHPYGGSSPSYTNFDAVFTNNTRSLSGDSGAPYGNGPAFLGIHNATNMEFTQTVLSKAANANLNGSRGDSGALSLSY